MPSKVTLLSKMRKTIFTSIIFLLLVSFSFAFEEYDYNGYNNDLNGNGLWNDVTGITYNVFGVSGGNDFKGLPIYADIDNDGNIEIVVINDDTLYIIEEPNTIEYTLDLDIYATGDNFVYSNIVLANMDSDDNIEINIVQGGEDNNHQNFVYIWEWDGSSFNSESVFNVSDSLLLQNTGKLNLGCENKRCLVTSLDDAGNDITYYGYNYTYLSTGTYAVAGGLDYLCIPENSGAIRKDIDNDNEIEFLTTYHRTDSSTSEQMTLLSIEAIPNGAVTLENSVNINGANWLGTALPCVGGSASDLFKNSITQPVLFDITGTPNEEIFFAWTYGGNLARMYAYDTSFSEIEVYPENGLGFTSEIDANYISNVFELNADSGDNEICFMGIADTTLNMVCAYDVGFNDDLEFSWDKPFNLSIVDESPMTTHVTGVETKAQISTRDELLTSYGVYEIIDDDTAELIYPVFSSDAVYMPITDDGNGYFDLIELTQYNINYYEDGLYNQNCQDYECLDYIEICPDFVNGIAKVNETFRLRVKFIDEDDDIINYTAYVYYGEDNEQSYSSLANSGSTYSILSLKLNETTTTSTFRLEYADVENPSNVATYEQNMLIQNDGLLFSDGECFSGEPRSIYEEEIPLDLGDLTTPCSENSDCNSGYCEYNTCQLKPSNYACNLDAECLSGNCLENKCTKPSLSDSLNQGKNSQFGSDSATGNIVSLFLIVGLTIVIIVGSGGSLAGIVVGGFTFVATSILFTILGWLSPFILLGVFIVLLFGIVVMVMLGGN